MPIDLYTLEAAEEHIAQLRGQVDKLNEILSLNDSAQPVSPSGGHTLFSVNGQPQYVNPRGLAASLSGAQLANVGAASATGAVLTSLATWPIPASDAVAGAIYRLSAFGRGTWGSAATGLTWRGDFAGFDGGTETIPSGFLPINTPFRWDAQMTAICATPGSGATWITLLKGSINAFAIAQSTSMPFSASLNGVVTQTALAANAMSIQVAWGTGGLATITATASWPEKVAG